MSGVVSSINTNSAAMVAVESLNSINSSLQSVQTAVSTGYSVNSASDNGAAYAVAQSVRTNMAGLTAANQQLGDTQGLLSTTSTALTNVSNLMQSMDATLVNLSSSTLSSSQRSQYVAQFSSQMSNVQSFIKGASYNGISLVSGTSAALTPVSASFTSAALTVTADASGSTLSIASTSLSSVYNALTNIGASLATLTGTTTVAGYLSAGGKFSDAVSSIGSTMNTYGNLTNQINSQITYNQNKMDALSNGLGALVDANMAAESAKLQSLQIQQQLATSALSIADQSPSLLTKLFP